MKKAALILLVIVFVVAGFNLIYVEVLQSTPALASPRVAGCDTVSCTMYLPIVIAPDAAIPAQFEMTQGVQQPDDSVLLVADRPTYVRWTLTSSAAYTNVSALLYGERGGVPLPDSPISALNNPRTLPSTTNRLVLNDTFNFKLPGAWLSGDVHLSAKASNSTGFLTQTTAVDAHFNDSAAMHITIVPIEYHCSNGAFGATTPAGPYTYLTSYTFRTYPVPSIITATHAAVQYNGPCNSSGVPQPSSGSEWSQMLDTVSQVHDSEPNAVGYYYGLVHIDCSSGCIAGLGWIGWPEAIGFDGFGSVHTSASETNAHEVGHNHGRYHAPGCGALGVDSSFPYNPDGRARIGDDSHQNDGFNIDTQGVYDYSSYFDFMSYCGPEWVSDYTYKALWNFDNTQSTVNSSKTYGNRSLLISGSIDPLTDQVAFDPVYAIDNGARLPEPGDYDLEMLDSADRVLAIYSFAARRAQPDRALGAPADNAVIGFHLTLPAVDGLATIRVRHGSTIAGSLATGKFAPILRAPAQTDQLSSAGQVSWSGVDAGGSQLYYLVRVSADSGQTWQTIGVNLTTPQITLSPADFGGQAVQVQVLASNGLRTSTLNLGPYFVPKK